MWFFFVVGCASDPSGFATKDEVEELRQRVAALEKKNPSLPSHVIRSAHPKPIPTRDTGAVAAPRCKKNGEVYTLPPEIFSTEELGRQARIVPVRGGDGQKPGFKVMAIRKGSVLDSCGFKNGDILLSLNSHALRTPQSAFEAYKEYSDAKEIKISLTRDGTPVELHLRKP